MKNYSAKDVDAYIANASPEARPKLEELRKIIKSAVPKVEEQISWGIPFYRHQGLLAGFAVFKQHVSFGFCDLIQNSERELLEKQGYKTGKKTVQIKFGQKAPSATIKKILKAKAKMNEDKKILKK